MIPTDLENEHRIKSISRLYYRLYVSGRQSVTVDLSDLEQAGRIAVFNISQKRPDKLDHKGYVSAAIKYACINEIKKMRNRVPQVYLAHQHEEMVPIVDLLPTRETAPDSLDRLDDLLYQIRQEFSPKEAEGLDALIQKCDNVYDLNLSAPPSTDTKDRVKIVTAMDLDDEEMIIYALVLLGAIAKFPRGYLSSDNRGKELSKKYLKALLDSRGMSLPRFVESHERRDFLNKYRLDYFIKKFYDGRTRNLLLEVDPSLLLDMHLQKKDKLSLAAEEIRQIIREGIEQLEDTDIYRRRASAEQLKREPGKLKGKEIRKCLAKANVFRILNTVLNDSPYLAIEFAFPETYPEYTQRAKEIWDKHNRNGVDFFPA